MPKLDELIRDLCPDEVESVPLWSVTIWDKRFSSVDRKKQPKIINYSYLLASDLFAVQVDGGDVFLLSTGEQTGWTTKELAGENLREGEVVTIPWGKSRPITDCIKYYKGKFVTADNRIMTSNDTKKLSNKYLYYWIMSQGRVIDTFYRGTGIKHPDMAKVLDMLIQIPPLEIQREIVRILDNFTNLTAELTARNKQYAYYRDELLRYKMPTKEYEVGEICEVSAGGDAPKEHFSKEKSEQYKVPIISNGCGINALYGYTDVARVDKPAVTVAARGTIGYAEYRDYPYFPIIRLITLIPRDDKQLNAKYLYYSLEGRHYKVPTSGIPQLTVPVIKKEKVSIPPLDVQNRIVNVLDNFEKICSDLNIGLPAEIEARQKQYEYYRDKLLTFAETGNTILSRAEQSRALIKLLQYVFGYAVVSLQDVVKNSCSGGTPKKGVSEYYEDGNIPWLRTQEVVFRDICKTECFITESAVKNSAAKWIPENCVIVAISGATAGRCAINKIPLTTNQHCLNLEVDPEMALYRYVYYCICAKQEELLAKKEGARGDLNSTRILSLQIDLPSIEEQKRIVSILDRFDTICNDLTSGLPAEIEARQKQYEFYRDKLLSFKELN